VVDFGRDTRMNYLYCGLPFDDNMGNGKTISAVEKVFYDHIVENKTIYSNIKLKSVEYTKLIPENLGKLLDINNAVFLFDEIHAMFYKNHKFNVNCKQHPVIGLCYLYAEFIRQVRKLGVDTVSTSQTLADCHYQIRTLMNTIIICEKYHIIDNKMYKCESVNKCPSWHEHCIKQTNYKTGKVTYFYPSAFYNTYDTEEIVRGWV